MKSYKHVTHVTAAFNIRSSFVWFISLNKTQKDIFFREEPLITLERDIISKMADA